MSIWASKNMLYLRSLGVFHADVISRLTKVNEITIIFRPPDQVYDIFKFGLFAGTWAPAEGGGTTEAAPSFRPSHAAASLGATVLVSPAYILARVSSLVLVYPQQPRIFIVMR